jgi:L-rhamnose mutarotase
LQASQAGMDKEEINLKWQAFMQPFFESAEGRPDEQMMELTEVFHTD